MRKVLVAIAATAMMAFGGITLANAAPPSGGHGSACPPSSPAMGGDPSCGKPRPSPPPPGCTLGPITTQVDAIDFGPLDGAVHDVLCALAANHITI